MISNNRVDGSLFQGLNIVIHNNVCHYQLHHMGSKPSATAILVSLAHYEADGC